MSLDEIIVDNFAGGGGASTGIELATGRIVDIAINHDPDAILMHKTNHPHTEHLQASVWDVDPVEVCRGRPVGLAWFSPDCKHFSKAKGAALVDKKIRGLAWIVLRWAGTVRPRVIILENVEEFVTWGAVRKGRPVKKFSGSTFRKWKKQLLDLGYHVEHRELVAADYGAPTIRKRFVLIARCDGKPIVWPERTHAPADSPEVKSGKCKPWRSAAEIIDWSLPMYSIFDTKAEIKEKYGVNAVRPLADNTLRRIIRGVNKFTIRSGKPFIMQNRFQNAPQDIDRPLTTITAVGAHELCAGQLIQYHTEQTENVRAAGMEAPIQTIDSSNRYGLVSANLVEYFSTGRPLDISEPMHTITSRDREALTMVHIQKYYGGVIGSEAKEPLPTVTGIDHNALCASHIVKFKGTNLGQTMEEPLQTITAQSNPYCLCHTIIQKYDPSQDVGYWPEVRELLNKHCDYSIKEDEIILLLINGTAYYIRDITLRMLAPTELYSAMGFPKDYIIERDYLGHKYGKSKQVARCGNAVSPPLAEALVRANYESYPVAIVDMTQLFSIIERNNHLSH